MILLFKAMAPVSGYTRKDGVFVSPHMRRVDDFADRAHAGQYRKARPGQPKVPYIEHPRAVARILHDEAGVDDTTTLTAALLHDTIEDTGVTHANIVAEFGHDVADVVAELTNDPSVPKSEKTAAQVAKAGKMSARAAAVKVADKTANLRDLLETPPDWDAARIRRYYDDASLVVGAMAHRHPVLEAIFHDIYNRGIAKI